MVDVPAEGRIDVADDADLSAGVFLIGGEARFRHLYCVGGAVADVLDDLAGDPRRPGRGAQPRRGDRPRLVRRGRPRGAAADRRRRGRVPRRPPRCCRTDGFPYETRLIGMHGSLSEDEMLIPLLVD